MFVSIFIASHYSHICQVIGVADLIPSHCSRRSGLRPPEKPERAQGHGPTQMHARALRELEAVVAKVLPPSYLRNQGRHLKSPGTLLYQHRSHLTPTLMVFFVNLKALSKFLQGLSNALSKMESLLLVFILILDISIFCTPIFSEHF